MVDQSKLLQVKSLVAVPQRGGSVSESEYSESSHGTSSDEREKEERHRRELERVARRHALNEQRERDAKNERRRIAVDGSRDEKQKCDEPANTGSDDAPVQGDFGPDDPDDLESIQARSTCKTISAAIRMMLNDGAQPKILETYIKEEKEAKLSYSRLKSREKSDDAEQQREITRIMDLRMKKIRNELEAKQAEAASSRSSVQTPASESPARRVRPAESEADNVQRERSSEQTRDKRGKRDDDNGRVELQASSPGRKSPALRSTATSRDPVIGRVPPPPTQLFFGRDPPARPLLTSRKASQSRVRSPVPSPTRSHVHHSRRGHKSRSPSRNRLFGQRSNSFAGSRFLGQRMNPRNK